MTIPNERSQPVRTVGFEMQSQRVTDCEINCIAPPKPRKQPLTALRAEALFDWLTIAVAAGLIAYTMLHLAGVAP